MAEEIRSGSVPEGWIEVGLVVKPHGVRGAVKIRLHNDESASLEQLGPSDLILLRQSSLTVRGVSITGRAGGLIVAAVKGVADRTAAEQLRGARLLVPRSEIRLDVDEYLYADLIGCEVREKEKIYGVVREVFCVGASDVLVVRNDAEERLIPLVDDWVVEVDVQRKAIEIRDGEQWDSLPAGGGETPVG